MSVDVGIIIPSYNGRKFIEKTINSCLDQTYESISIIIIDDCSTDDTKDLLSIYKGRVTLLFNEDNLGIVKSINRAMEKVNSKYFLLLGHDDVLPKNHIELMLSEFEPGVVGVHCNSIIINNFDEETGFARNDKEQNGKTNNCLFELSLDNFISSCGMLHRTSIFKKIKGWDESYLHYGEWLYYIRALDHGIIKYSTKTKAYYRRHDTNITNTFKDKDVVKKLNDYKNTCRRRAFRNNNNSVLESLKYLINNVKLTIRRIIL